MADGDGNSTGNNLIWAITTLLIVAIIGGAIYFLALKTDSAKPGDTKINVTVPAR